jgi:acyl dehydratase
MPDETSESASPRHYEDLAVGRTFGTGAFTVEPVMIPAFAEFDPQPFHSDRDAARASPFGGMAADG